MPDISPPPPITGFGNMAMKVEDLDAAIAYYEGVGAVVRDRQVWRGAERADVILGDVMLTLFTEAIYEQEVDLEANCFLHVAVFVDDVDLAVKDRQVIFGPVVVSGSFGTRKIAFIDAPGGIRLKFMEQLETVEEA